MNAQTFNEILSSWQPQYRLAPRGPPVYVKEADEPGFSFLDCEWVLTDASLEEGLAIAERALQADKIWNDAHRQIATAVAKAQILAAVPQTFKISNVALTLCPDHGDHETMLQIAKIVDSVSCVLGGKYVIEQRSEPGAEPYGWHLHFMIQTTYAPSRVKQYVQQAVSARGYVATYWATPADERWHTNYMEGNKFDEKKDLKVKQDRILRAKYGLQDIYDLKPKEPKERKTRKLKSST